MGQQYFDKGISYFEGKDYQAAIRQFTHCIENDPQNAEAYCKRGGSYQCLEQYDLALKDYNKAIEINDKDPEPYINRGFVYGALKQYELAINDFSKLIEMDREKQLGYFIRGNAYKQMGRFKEAIEDFNRGIQLDDSDPQIYNALGLTYACLGQYQEAIESYNESIRVDPQNAQTWCFRGLSQNSLGNYEQALEDYNKSIELNADNYCAFNNRGLVYTALGEYSQAIEDYSRAIELERRADTYYNRGEVKLQLKRYEQALEDYQHALAAQPSNPLYLLRITQLYKKMGDQEKSKESFIKAVSSLKSQSEAQMIVKQNMQKRNIEQIQRALIEYEDLMYELEKIQAEAIEAKHEEILKGILQLKVRIEVWMANAIFMVEKKSKIKEKEDLTSTQENNYLRKKLQQLSKMMKQSIKDQESLKKDQNQFKQQPQAVNKKNNARLASLEDKIQQLSKQIHVTEQIINRINTLDHNRLEYYNLLYQTLINHFLVYRVVATGFFTGQNRQFNITATVIGAVTKVQSLTSKISVLGDLLSIPFKIMSYCQSQKSNVLKSALAGKIICSRFKSNNEITKSIEFTIAKLIQNKTFNRQLSNAIKDKESPYIQRICSRINIAQSFIYSKMFSSKKQSYSYVEQVVALHMTLITKGLIEVDADKFASTTKQNKLFYQFILNSIAPESSTHFPQVQTLYTESRIINERQFDETEGKINYNNSILHDNNKDDDSKSKRWWQLCCFCL